MAAGLYVMMVNGSLCGVCELGNLLVYVLWWRGGVVDLLVVVAGEFVGV